jgi:hypothetical protein
MSVSGFRFQVNKKAEKLQTRLRKDALILARILHESPAATEDMAVLPGVLGCRTLRRTVQVRLGSNPLRLPGGTPFSTVSQRKFVKHPGWHWFATSFLLPVFVPCLTYESAWRPSRG